MTARHALEDRSSSPPESEVVRKQVVVALVGREPPLAAIELARRVAAAMRAPLHGLFVWPTPMTPADVPRLLNLTPEQLEGMVIDVEVGDPLTQLGDFVTRRPTGFLVVPA